MAFLSLFAVAVALALDAFAVALVAGVTLPHVGFRQTCRLSWHFGLFQGMMTVAGWGAGLTVKSFVESFGHWLAFLLLSFVGIKMIFEAVTKKGETQKKDPTKGGTMVMLAVATSIDALAVGLSFAFIDIDVKLPSLIIGLVAAFFTAAGLHLGRIIKNISRLGEGVEVLGGLVLIAIGVRILLDNM